MSVRTSRYSLALGMILALTVAVYANSLTATFSFDDEKLLRSLAKAGPAFWPAWRVSVRPVALFTFYLNYWLAGREPVVFHATNLLIHLANGIMAFLLVRRSLESPAVPMAWRERADRTGLMAAALFLIHPIQTMAVTYVTQRYESLTATFSLMAVLSYARSAETRQAPAAVGWTLAAVAAYVLALGCKQTAVIVPVLLLLYGTVFLSHLPAWRRFLLPAALMTASTIVGIAVLRELSASPWRSVGFGAVGMDSWHYLITECRVLLTYLRLLVLPANQTMDYDYPLVRSLADPGAAAGLFLAVSLILSALVRIRAWRVPSFFILWFFICLAPTSSIVPIVDFINEYRVYLASVGFFVPAAAALVWVQEASRGWFRRAGKTGGVVLLALLAVASFHRNATWRTEVILWEDAVAKAPDKARTRFNLGNAYQEAGRMEDALHSYEQAVRLNPNRSDAHNNLANSYLYFGRIDEAAESYRSAVEMDSRNFEAQFNLGMILVKLGRPQEAAPHLQRFIKDAPAYYSSEKIRAREVLEEALREEASTRR